MACVGKNGETVISVELKSLSHLLALENWHIYMLPLCGSGRTTKLDVTFKGVFMCFVVAVQTDVKCRNMKDFYFDFQSAFTSVFGFVWVMHFSA